MTKNVTQNVTKRNDWILILILAAAALLLWGGMALQKQRTAGSGEAVVTIDGVFYGSFPLTEACSERIELPDGSYNLLQIAEGKADITEASCPDKVCVDHAPVDTAGEIIVCLPNQVVITIENSSESEVDAVVR